MNGLQNLYWWQVFNAAMAAGLCADKARRMAFDAVMLGQLTPE